MRRRSLPRLTRHQIRFMAGVGYIAALVAGGYFALKLAPDWFAETERLKVPKEVADVRQGVRTAALAVLAGALASLGAIFTARTYSLNRQGQITDRFSRAIDQLGHQDQLDVRLGGIYALERIARESKIDHGPIMEVLTAYVRRRSPWPAREASSDNDDEAGDASAPSTAAIDIQAVMTVLARRQREHEKQPFPFRLGRTNLRGIDVRGIDLHGADLHGAQLQDAILGEAQMARANLEDAQLQGANLGAARLWFANLRNAQLREAYLWNAEFVYAHLENAQLAETYLTGARFAQTYLTEANLAEARGQTTDFENADLQGANLRKAQLSEANFHGAQLVNADLGEARLGNARLQGANLGKAQLQQAYLGGTNFQDAYLQDANLRGAELQDANLRGAQMQGAELEDASLAGATYNAKTAWPEGFDYEAAGAVRAEQKDAT